jgi:hypothetical protein
MLGTRRSTVDVAAGILHKAGLIDYARGRVNVLNRKGLGEVPCECYCGPKGVRSSGAALRVFGQAPY